MPTSPIPGVPSDYTTVTQVLDVLRDEGYDGDFLVTQGGALACRTCGTESPPDTVHTEAIRRLEGASDPADMAAVLALRCPSCDTRGTAVVKYGPDAEPEEVEVLLALDDERGDQPGTGATGG